MQASNVIKYLLKKIRLLTVPRKEPYLLLSSLNVIPKHIQYYQVAFSHKSAAIKLDGHEVDNERLEFLGDALLDAVAADILYRRYPNRKEGFLTNTRSKMVQRETLNKVALDLGLDHVVTIQNKMHQHNINIYGNALEALVGAIFLDYGYAGCLDFFENVVLARFLNIEKLVCEEQNFKSRLIEWCQKNKAKLEFELLDCSEDGDKTPQFKSMALVNNIQAGSGSGYTKRESQQKAAQKALMKVRSHKMLYLTSNVVEQKGDGSDNNFSSQ